MTGKGTEGSSFGHTSGNSGGSRSEFAPWEIGKVVLNNYVVRDILGQGGMGNVYLVESHSPKGEKYAVKTLLESALTDQTKKLSFLRELRIWVDLPEHPNLVACRFFRTIEDYLAVFSEYVDGGSVLNAILNGSLLPMEKILDIAIQSSWGLQAAHDQGVIHQDIKPSNILLNRDGVAKVTDFGLARARHVGGIEALSTGSTQTVMVSTGGMTIAYCSPEQAMGLRLNHKTDIWSWGLTVLEMFTGKLLWKIGTVAERMLNLCLEKGPFPPYPAIPDKLADLLYYCFRDHPNDRWKEFNEISNSLTELYRDIVGKPFPRTKPRVKTERVGSTVVHDRYTVMGLRWDDPADWLKHALECAGRNLSEMKDLIPRRTGSWKVQTLVDLEVYEIAERIYIDLMNKGRNDVEDDFARLLFIKALVLDHIDDMPGAIAMCNKSIEIMERLAGKDSRPELSEDLAKVYMNKAVVLSRRGDQNTALELCDQVIRIRRKLIYEDGRTELMDKLAWVYMDKAIVLSKIGEIEQAMEILDESVQILEAEVYEKGKAELGNALAKSLSNKANTLYYTGKFEEAIRLYDKSIDIRENQSDKFNHPEVTNSLAVVYLNKAASLNELGKHSLALDLYNKSIKIWENLVYFEGRSKLIHHLAKAYLNKAIVMRNVGRDDSAIRLFDLAIDIYESQVYQEGRTELTLDVALGYMQKAIAVSRLDDWREALVLYDKAVAIWEKLVYQDQRTELLGDLAMARTYKAGALLYTGDKQRAKTEVKEVIPILKAEMERTKRADLRNMLDWVTANLPENGA